MMGWPEGTARVVLEETDSTQTQAFARSDDAPVWVLAHRQTSGTGRRGRPWQMPTGNFAATLALRPKDAVHRRSLRSFTAALALRDALSELTGQPALFSLKWPNDVLCRGRKLAGILLESRGDVLLIGIGINLAAAPAHSVLEQGSTAPIDLLSASGQLIGAEDMLDALAPAFAEREARLLREGFDPQQAEWMRGATRLGQPIVARFAQHELSGRFDGIDSDGALLLSTAEGIQRLPAAEIYFNEAG